MTPLQRKLPSGRVHQVAAPLPVASDEKLSVVLLGNTPGFLTRFLDINLLRPNFTKVVVAPRLVQVPGRSAKTTSFGSAEALQARKDGVTRSVMFKPDPTSEVGSVIDITPQALYARETIWQIPSVQRHELVIAALTSWIPVPPSGGEQVMFIEFDPSVSEVPIRTRLSSVMKCESPVDHLLYELVYGDPLKVIKHDIENVILVSPSGQAIMRLDVKSKLTETPIKLISALMVAERGFTRGTRGDNVVSDMVPGDGGYKKIPLKGVSFIPPQSVPSPSEPSAGAPDAVAVPATPAIVVPVSERKRLERIRQYNLDQNSVNFPTRSGNPVKLGTISFQTTTPPVTSRKATGVFSNDNVSKPVFDAISTSYVESGMLDRDMAAIVSSLSNDPLVPHFIQKIERKNSSDEMNLKETISIQYRDPSGRPTTVHVDIPIVTRDGYLVLNGNKYSITKQILAMPIIKVKPDEVLITTAYNKATVERFGQNASAMSSYIRLLAATCSKGGVRGIKIELASATAANASYKSTVEYNDVARTVRSIKSPSFAFIFSRPALEKELKKVTPWFDTTSAFGPGGHAVGWSHAGTKVIGMLPDGTLAIRQKDVKDVILPDDNLTLGDMIYTFVKESDLTAVLPAPTVLNRKYSYSRVKMLSQYLPTAVIVGYDLGLLEMLKRADISFEVIDLADYRRAKYAGRDAIKFKDGVVVFDPKRIRDSLLVNGLKELDTDETDLSDFEAGGNGWVEHIANRLGSPGHAKALVNYQASFIDPMTKDLLKSENLPTDMSGVLLHASAMLENNQYGESNDMKSYRLRGPELINSLLYKVLHKEMERVRATRESASPQKLMVNQNEVIRAVQGASNVEEVSQLNPLLEVELRGKATWTGASGGLSDGRTVNRAMRAYHKSMKGIFGFYSPDSAEIGVKRTLAFGAAVKDVRGRFDHDLVKSDAAQILALGELISPFTAQHSDPPRIGMQSKQATHTMPIRKHTPLLVGSGAEKALAVATGNTYTYKARTNGKVVSIDEKSMLMKLLYDDGETAYVDMAPRSIKNSGGGFYITAQLQPNPGIKVGAKFKTSDILAHDPSYFSSMADGSTAYKSGILVRTAIVALDQTYEDSLMVTEKLTQDTAALVTMSRSVNLGARTNLQKIAKVGDMVNPNSALAVFENVTDDADISNLLLRVGKEFDDAVADLTRNTAVSKYAGKIVEIRVHYNKEIDELSPSLQRFIKSGERSADDRRRAASGSPVDEPVHINAPVKITRDKIGGEVVDGVLITFLIQVEDVAGPGDKLVASSPLKGIISRVFEVGEEPIDEEGNQVDYIMSPLSIVSRMTGDVFLTMWSNSILIDLKKAVTDIYAE